ncbi:OmpA family protein [Aquimarina litoralis]|nr:OmpA family protein [Aquimarina litoralis]
MKNLKKVSYVLLIVLVFGSCKTMKKAEIGGLIGAASGAVIGGIVGDQVDDTELGAVIGGMVGATVGGIIGNQMDKQAKKIEEEMPSVVVQRVEEDINIVFDEQSGVYFETNQHDLNTPSKETIHKLATVLKEYPNSNILIEGHTDNVGKEESNFLLSKYRAHSVKEYLVEQGVDEQRFTVRYYGESQPKYDNNTIEGKSKNRRVEVTISPNEELRRQAVAQIRE